MVLTVLLFAAAFSLAAAAGVFSIAGLAITYGGSFWAVVALGSTIEFGKLMGVSFLYRFWAHISWTFRAVVGTLILGVMIVTSLGVFGFLTKANQIDMVAMKQTQATLQLLETEQLELTQRKAQIDEQIAKLPASSVSGRIRLSREFKEEQARINARLPEIAVEKAKLSTAQIQQQADIGPLIYIAKSLGYYIEIATTWFTLLLVAVFDPLAVVLTICANIAYAHRIRVNATPPNQTIPLTILEQQPSSPSAGVIHDNVPVPDMVEDHVDAKADLPDAQTDTPVAHVDFADVEWIQPIAGPIFKDRVHKVTVDPSTSEETVSVEYKAPSVDAEDRALLTTDWNHYVNRRLSAVDSSSFAEKIEQLTEFVKELDAQPTMTDDEVILRSRIINFIERHAT